MKYSLQELFIFKSTTIIDVAEIYCEIIVAIATPATLILNLITSIKFNDTLTSPETESMKSGFFVSPVALTIPAPKLNTIPAGAPKKNIFK